MVCITTIHLRYLIDSGSWVKGFALQDLTLEAAPQDFKAKLELEATAIASKEPVSIQSSKELFSASILGVGITVAGIFKLGATVSYEVSISATFAVSPSQTLDSQQAFSTEPGSLRMSTALWIALRLAGRALR